jgi:glutamyl-tRNA synthetase
MDTNNRNIVTRFAPSPTGFMHIGGVRTALFAYLWARKNRGTFILRIEDTDKEREVAGSIEHIQESLRWLGLEWDFGPDKPGTFGSCIQSERLPTYLEFAHRLIEKGLAYPDPYSSEQVAEFRKQAEAEKRPFLFRNHRPEAFEKWDGTEPLRFKVPEIKRYRWHDAVRGDLEAGEEALDDFILIKSDGYPTYNFAHIIDDFSMGVTHIMRADEFISSTPRFLSLYEALGIAPPVFVTLPPILRDDRTKKLGKRDGAKDILDYRAEGYLPEAMANFLALTGWNPGTEQEIFTMDDLIAAFDIAKIQKAGAAFNEEKLLWANREHIKNLSHESLLRILAEFGAKSSRVAEKKWDLSEEFLSKIAPIVVERLSVFGEFTAMLDAGEFDYFLEEPTVDASKIVWKEEGPEKARDALLRVSEILEKISESNWNSEAVKEAIWPYAEERGRGGVLWPMRYSLSGKDKSPDPFTIAGVLGREETLKRLKVAAENL